MAVASGWRAADWRRSAATVDASARGALSFKLGLVFQCRCGVLLLPYQREVAQPAPRAPVTSALLVVAAAEIVPGELLKHNVGRRLYSIMLEAHEDCLRSGRETCAHRAEKSQRAFVFDAVVGQMQLAQLGRFQDRCQSGDAGVTELILVKLYYLQRRLPLERKLHKELHSLSGDTVAREIEHLVLLVACVALHIFFKGFAIHGTTNACQRLHTQHCPHP